ncbi:MAG: DUF58 domain-containing protein [Marinobacterium sp.]|nr:DUF58 domain-containing protein [Marinobacterium sp.]
MQPRPVPARRDQIELAELLALRHWPPARGGSPARLALKDGRHLSPVRGRGMEFDDVRRYQPGDDIRLLDWRLLARTGELHTRLYREERERPVFLLLDMSASMQFASRGYFKSLLAAYAASLVAWAAQRGGDRIGGQVLCSDGQQPLYRPFNSRQSVTGLIAAMAEQVGKAGQHRADLQQVLRQLDGLLATGSQCYLFSDFRGLNDELCGRLQRLARRCELQLVMLSDPLERTLPEGDSLCFAGNGQQIRLAAQDSNTRTAYAARFVQRLEQLEQLGRWPNIAVHHWSTDAHPLFDVVSQYDVVSQETDR